MRKAIPPPTPRPSRPAARSAEDWARELDCSVLAAREAIANLIAKGLIHE